MKQSQTTFRARRLTGDGGFTLMEVIVSILLITIVMTAVLSFFISGVKASADRERRAVAVQVATQQMEVVRAVPVGSQPSTASGTVGQVASGSAGLVLGRSQTAVGTQWAATATSSLPAAPTELSTMNPAYEGSTVSGTVNLPLTVQTQQVGTEKYDVRTYVGFCYASTSGCVKNRVNTSDVPVYKAVVQVSWDQGKGNVKQYVTSTLIDASTDQIYKGT